MTEVTIVAGGVPLSGDLVVPPYATSLVAFVHTAGRLHAKSRALASSMQQRGFATLLFDLLTPEEAAIHRRSREMRFDATKFGRRVGSMTDWLRAHRELADFDIGYFASSNGAAAALVAAAHHPDRVKAIVARGGRPDLAMEVLPKVRAATLLIVAADDPIVEQLNRHAMQYLECDKRLEVVRTLDDVSELAARWFAAHVRASVVA